MLGLLDAVGVLAESVGSAFMQDEPGAMQLMQGVMHQWERIPDFTSDLFSLFEVKRCANGSV